VIDYPCANFGDFSFSRFGFIVRTDIDRQNHRCGSTLLTRLRLYKVYVKIMSTLELHLCAFLSCLVM